MRQEDGGREGKAVTYRHYVLAPDPEDGIDLDTLRAYAKEWVVKAFGPGATAAIVYHDDNHERLKKGLQGIPHAHICINALYTQTAGNGISRKTTSPARRTSRRSSPRSTAWRRCRK